jgi:2,4-dienoyl-CoA reductase-like NADH-dependent reductase (Old Yellow Enzyme family)/NADPH-dependent 2,4-dienoyl-CoA reductase/sulfur reductase-like enzyme
MSDPTQELLDRQAIADAVYRYCRGVDAVHVAAAMRPLAFGHITLRNRVAVTAHITGFATDGRVTRELIDYHAARARGGVGLIVTETGSVHHSYRPQGIQYFQPDAGDGLARLADAVHEQGARIVGQLNHGGAQAPPSYDGRPQWSASYNDGQNGGSARAMTVAEIHEVTDAFIAAAVLLARSGYDGCEVHCAHSYLLNHFLSPLYNRRDDDYGGSFERRLTFLREVLAGIRDAVGAPFVTGIRLGAEIGPRGLGPQELTDIGKRISELGLIDYASFSLGGRTPESLPLMTGTMERPVGYELAWNEQPSRALDIPTLVTGRFRTLAEVGKVVQSGAADLVGMTRAHIADPQIVLKTATAGAGHVRPCISCNECQGALLTAGRIRCAVNASLPGGLGTGDAPVDRPPAGRRLLVAGGGPAGMEAARVAALSGYDVVLAEASQTLGGAARTAAVRMPNAPGMAEMTHWQEAELRRRGVDIRTGQTVDLAFAREVGAELAVVATGSAPRMDGVQSARPGQRPTGLPRAGVVSSLQALRLTREAAGTSAVVVDDIGDYEGIGVAEYLVDLGLDVTVVTPFPSLASPLDATYRPLTAVGRLTASGRFRVCPTAMLTAVGPSLATIVHLPSSREHTVPADTVVLVTRNRPVNALVAELTVSGIPACAVGDALAPRNFRTAIADGYRWESLAGVS